MWSRDLKSTERLPFSQKFRFSCPDSFLVAKGTAFSIIREKRQPCELYQILENIFPGISIRHLIFIPEFLVGVLEI